MATAQQILNCRMETGDTDVALPILSDEEYSYFIDKNSGSLSASCIDIARALLFKLSIRSQNSTVDCLSLQTKHAAEQYRQSLLAYLRDPTMNPVLRNTTIYAGNVSLSDMDTNDTTADNNYVSSPSVKNVNFVVDPDTNPFGAQS